MLIIDVLDTHGDDILLFCISIVFNKITQNHYLVLAPSVHIMVLPFK